MSRYRGECSLRKRREGGGWFCRVGGLFAKSFGGYGGEGNKTAIFFGGGKRGGTQNVFHEEIRPIGPAAERGGR